MEKINFTTLQQLAATPSSTIAAQSSECVENTKKVTQNLSEKILSLATDECALSIISLQNWLTRKTYNQCKITPKIGDIFFSDLGVAYNPEFAYPHPVLIIGQIGHYHIVVPVSSSQQNIVQAYHPQDNPSGKKFLRKVTTNDGFGRDCALLLSNIKTISGGRFLCYKSHITSNDLLDEINEYLFQKMFSKQYTEYRKVVQELADLKQGIIENK